MLLAMEDNEYYKEGLESSSRSKASGSGDRSFGAMGML
jgi:hypothetical protein